MSSRRPRGTVNKANYDVSKGHDGACKRWTDAFSEFLKQPYSSDERVHQALNIRATRDNCTIVDLFKDEHGLYHVYKSQVKLNQEPVSPQRLTYSNDRCTNPKYLYDGTIIYVSNAGGNAHFQIYLIDQHNITHKLSQDINAKSRLSICTKNYLYFSANINNKSKFDMYRQKLPLLKNNHEIICPLLSRIIGVNTVSPTDENISIISHYISNAHSELILIDMNNNGKQTMLIAKYNNAQNKQTFTWKAIRFNCHIRISVFGFYKLLNTKTHLPRYQIMSSPRKDVGRVKLPAKFAELGLKIDPKKMKPDAWINRKKSLGKKPTTPTLTESKHSEIDDIVAREEILTDIGKTYTKPTIPRSIRRKRSTKNKSHFITMTEEDETSNDTEETMFDERDNEQLTILQQELNKKELTISSQLQLIEQIKHEKLILEDWKNEIGLSAIEKCKNVEIQLEMSHNNIQQLQLQIEGLQTQNHAQKQQIQAYQDEIEKLESEKPKLQGQIGHFEQLLNEQYLINKRFSSKEEEFSNLKIEFESLKLNSNNSLQELKTLRKENDLIKKENNKYLQLFNKFKQDEIKLKNDLSNKEYQILELTKKNEEIYDKLKKETVENRKQLQVANDFANDLSDQLQEIQNFASSPRPTNNNKGDANGPSSSGDNIVGDGIGYGKPLFEKRKTLKVKYEHSLGLPNMSDIISDNDNTMSDIDDVDDEYYKKKVFSVKMNSKQLTPITQLNEFEYIDDVSIHDDDMDPCNNNDDEKDNETILNSSSTTLTFDSSTINEHLNINQIIKQKNTNHVPQLTDEIIDAVTDEGNNNNNNNLNAESFYINSKYVTANEQDTIDKLLRQIAGSSYYKFRNGTNVPMINAETRHKLKKEIIEYIDKIKGELYAKGIEKDTIIIQYKRLSEEWEHKYKTLKREIKKRKVKSAVNKQKVSEPVLGGCKFWSWGLNPKWYVDLTGNSQKEGSNPPHAVRFYVPDDSDDTENNSVI